MCLHTHIYIYILWGNKNPWQFWSQKSAPFLCPELCRIAAFYSKDHCSARKHAHYWTQYMGGTAPGHSSLYGRDRTGTALTHSSMAGTALRRSLLWPGLHRDAVYYGRDRTGTLITMAGTAPGPRWHTHYYGRDRTEMLFTMAGTAPGRWLLWPGPTHRLDLTK